MTNKSKLRSDAQRTLLRVLDFGKILCIKNCEKAWIIEMPELTFQLRTCSQLIRANLIRMAYKDENDPEEKVYYTISNEGRAYMNKIKLRKDYARTKE